MKILVVSPYPPRRCGIGAYAKAQVARLRSEGHEVTVLSPPDGDGDVRVPFLDGRAFFTAARLGRRFDRIVLHFQPSLYYRPRAATSKILASLGLLWLALRRRQLELLVHEADPPSLWRPDYALLRLAFGAAGRLSFHTAAERAALARSYRVKVRAGLVPHLVGPLRTISRERAREQLGLRDGQPMFLCPGFIQPSKGFDRALDAFASAGRGSLYLVGSVRDDTSENEAYARQLREQSARVPGATLIERFVSDREFDLWMAAADWVVLPYRRSWSSGVLARAHELKRPAIVSGVGGLPEQAGDSDIVFEGDEDLKEAFRRAAGPEALLQGDEPPGADGDENPLSDWDPDFQPPQPKRGRRMLLGFILVSVLLAALAQITLKHGMTQVTNRGEAPLGLRQPGIAVKRVAQNVFVWAGLATFAASAAVWLIVLSRSPLSFAYPFASLTYVVILVFDRFVLRQSVAALRWTGVALIIGGILLISRTPHS